MQSGIYHFERGVSHSRGTRGGKKTADQERGAVEKVAAAEEEDAAQPVATAAWRYDAEQTEPVEAADEEEEEVENWEEEKQVAATWTPQENDGAEVGHAQGQDQAHEHEYRMSGAYRRLVVRPTNWSHAVARYTGYADTVPGGEPAVSCRNTRSIRYDACEINRSF